MQHAGVEVVNLAVLDGGVRHLDGEGALIDSLEYKFE
jgi:hypothetical protein